MGIPTPVPPSDEQKSSLVERIIRGELTPEQAQERFGLSRAELKDWVRVYRREARRAFDDRVKSVLSTQGIDMGELSAAEFSGNVEDMSVAELLQTIQLGGKDAEIRIEQGRELSYIWCIDGEVVDASTGPLRGAAAVYRLLSLQRGRIQADFSPVERPRTINVSTQALLMESARRYDECRQLIALLGDTSGVFVPSDRSLAPDVQATADQFAVLRLFDGVRTLDEVVAHSKLADLETLTNIQTLMIGGLLERVRASRTSLRDLSAAPMTAMTPEASYLPLAASVGAPTINEKPRRWVWGVAALGAATLASAFALRFSEQQEAEKRAAAERSKISDSAARSAAAAATTSKSSLAPARPTAAFPTCPEGSVLLGEPRSGSLAPGSAPTAPTLLPFCMAKAEVTVEQYESCRERGACDAAATDGEPPEARLSPELRQHAKQVYGSQCNFGQVGRERHPINCVSFRQASTYCAANGGRLPTEGEWELAARGSEGRRFPWGDAAPSPTRLNACGSECKSWYRDAHLDSVFDGVMYEGDDGFAGTAPVGSFPAGATNDGIYDLLGNVAEWTSTAVDFGEAQREAKTPSTYVVRGGSFSSGVDTESAPALRFYLNAEARGRGVGFRCVYDPKT
jgi:formylglycine-generating enzyme required for sulfatase activity